MPVNVLGQKKQGSGAAFPPGDAGLIGVGQAVAFCPASPAPELPLR